MNDPSQMMNRGFGMWLPPPTAMGPPVMAPQLMENPNPMNFQNSRLPVTQLMENTNPMNFQNSRLPVTQLMENPNPMNFQNSRPVTHLMENPIPMNFQNSRPVFPDKRKMNNNWKGKKPSQGYKPPALSELQYQNRVKARRFYPKKKNSYSHQHPHPYQHPRFAPFAPRNTSSFIIRAKKSGGITSLVSPCPVTPAVLPTPKFSPNREVLMDMAKEEWGVDGYGSMSGLIRLRSPQDNEEIEEGGSSESDVEEHVEVERRLDHDLSRFEMVCPGDGLMGPGEEEEEEEREGDGQVARLEEENLLLKDRLYLMEREMGDLRRRLQVLEATCGLTNQRFGDVDQNFGDASADNNREENSINVNNVTSEENEGIVCSEKSASPARG